MPILTRKIGETIMIGDDITVTMQGVSGGVVKLGIDAPRGVSIRRGELPKPDLRGLPTPETLREMAARENHLMDKHEPHPEPDIDPALDPRNRGKF